jgi:hypothetical protein
MPVIMFLLRAERSITLTVFSLMELFSLRTLKMKIWSMRPPFSLSVRVYTLVTFYPISSFYEI